MKFIKASMDEKGNVIVESNEEFESEVYMIMEKVRSQRGKDECYLFLPSDKPGYGCPVNPDVTREEYLTNPAKYGICIYKNWRDAVVFE